jgi:hypothetical protein
MPPNIHSIPLRATILGADATPKANALKPLFMLLFLLFFKASKA